MTDANANRLVEIAQRLDELAEDGPSELTALAEELGLLAECWPVATPQGPVMRDRVPDWARDVIRHLERTMEIEMRERMYGRSRGTHDYDPVMDLRMQARVDRFDAALSARILSGGVV